MTKLEVLEQELITVQTRLKEIKDKIEAEKQRLIREEFGIDIGSVIQDNKGIDHKITEITTRHYEPNVSKPLFLKGVPKKSDGNWSKREVNLYKWEVPQN